MTRFETLSSLSIYHDATLSGVKPLVKGKFVNLKTLRLIEGLKLLGKWQVRGLNADIARETGFTPSYVGKVFKGVNEPADKFYVSVSEAFGINRRWVLEGKEPVMAEPRVFIVSHHLNDHLESLAELFSGGTIDNDEGGGAELVAIREAVRLLSKMPKSMQWRAVGMLEEMLQTGTSKPSTP